VDSGYYAVFRSQGEEFGEEVKCGYLAGLCIRARDLYLNRC